MLPRVRIPSGLWKLTKEVARHLLRRPVVGIAAVARTPDGRYVLIRRSDTGLWALPGGTLEWGETMRSAIERELHEEVGSRLVSLGEIIGVYSKPDRDPRFHAVTVVVAVSVTEPDQTAVNPVEVTELGLFHEAELPHVPSDYSHGMQDMVKSAVSKSVVWE